MYAGLYRSSGQGVLCHRCLGDGCNDCDDGFIQGPEDIDSEDQPFIEQYRRGDVEPYFRAYMWLREYKVLPRAGGLDAQSAHFAKVVDWCDRVVSRWRSKQREREEAAQKLMQMQNTMMSKLR
jgi:hypothetical protein